MCNEHGHTHLTIYSACAEQLPSVTYCLVYCSLLYPFLTFAVYLVCCTVCVCHLQIEIVLWKYRVIIILVASGLGKLGGGAR